MKARKVSKLRISKETLRGLETSDLRQVAAGATTPLTVCNNLCTERCTNPSCYC